MNSEVENRIQYAGRIVDEQIPVFQKYLGRVESDWKYDGSRVTEADHAISDAFRDALLSLFPEDQFFSEELDHEAGVVERFSRFSWLIDPIDGTNNFARGLPNCSISLALLEHGVPIYGYIYDYGLRSVLHGGPGKGVFINKDLIRPSWDLPWDQSLVTTQTTSKKESIACNAELQKHFKIRCYGSSAIHMGYAAIGITDGVVAFKVNSWDIAAGLAMMEAAGGCTVYFDTNPFPLNQFDVTAPPIGYVSGSQAMVESILEKIGRNS